MDWGGFLVASNMTELVLTITVKLSGFFHIVLHWFIGLRDACNNNGHGRFVCMLGLYILFLLAVHMDF